MLVAWTHWDVVPAEIVVFQQAAEPLGEASLARHDVARAGQGAGEEGSHQQIIARDRRFRQFLG
jgi:hypothetical protein